jgi:hypothetical protein
MDKITSVAMANAEEKEPPTPVRTPKGKRTKFTGMALEGVVASVKAKGVKNPKSKS